MNGKTWIIFGSISAAIAVSMGAFGAHGLEGWLADTFPEDSAKRLENWKTGATYQMYHSMGLILVGILMAIAGPRKLLTLAGWLMLAGVILFSGMLYGWAVTDSFAMVMIVPLGGLCFIAGWIAMAIGVCGKSLESKSEENS